MVDHWRHDRFPVGAHVQTLADQRAPLARTVEGKHVVPTFQCRCPVEEVELLDCPVITAHQYNRGSRSAVLGAPEEVARQRRPLVRDLDDVRRQVEQSRTTSEAVGLALDAGRQSRVERCAEQHQPGRPLVGRRSEEGRARADESAGGTLTLGHRDHVAGQRGPAGVPGVKVCAADCARRRQHLSGVCPAVRSGPKGAKRLSVEKVVLDAE